MNNTFPLVYAVGFLLYTAATAGAADAKAKLAKRCYDLTGQRNPVFFQVHRESQFEDTQRLLKLLASQPHHSQPVIIYGPDPHSTAIATQAALSLLPAGSLRGAVLICSVGPKHEYLQQTAHATGAKLFIEPP